MPNTHNKPTRVTWQRLTLGAIVIAVVLFAGEELRPHLPAAERWIADQGIWAPVIFIVLMTLLSLICFPLDVLFIAAGLIFNLGWGFLYIAIALFLGQSINFWLARTLLRHRVRHWIEQKPSMRALDHAIRTRGIRLLFMLRLAPVPASPTSYLMGTTSIPYRHFLLASTGLLPVAFASMYFGYAAAHAAQTTDNPHHIFNTHDAFIFGSLIVAIALVAWIGHQARKVIREAEKDAG